MLKTAVLFLGVLAVAWGQSTPVNQCLFHNAPLPINTYIENCPSPPCQLPQLQDVVLHIIFRVPRVMRSMRTVATAYLIGLIGVPYDLGEQASTCNFLTNTYCPVLEDEVVTYTLNMFIESFMSVGISATIEFRINDDNNNPFVCVRVPISVIAPLTSSPTVREPRAPTANRTMPVTVKLDASNL